MSIQDRLKQMGITLPPACQPAAAYVMAVRSGSQLHVSGHIARQDGAPWVGCLGENMSTEQGIEAARSVALDLLATLQDQLGDLQRVERVVKCVVLVHSAPTFTEQHLVANGASQLLLDVLGDAGRHARSAFGVAQLPLGVCVEIELIADVVA
ncbi:RidA family protein [Pseudomonas putida]|uniref:RidA family protein n=1 Tax=Pseudomonas putida TaxID=303 RepID=UPI00383BC77B